MRIPFFRRLDAISTNQKIFRAAVIVGVLGFVSKGGIALKELVVARSFGRGDEIDSFLIALLLPAFVVNLLMGSMGAAFVPVFVETKEKSGSQTAQKLFSSVLFISVLSLTAVALLLGILAPYFLPWIGSSFSPEKIHRTQELLYCVLPVVVFSGLSSFISATLNAGEKFAFPALVPIVTPVITILLVIFGGHEFGAFALAAAAVLGSFIEATLVGKALKQHRLAFDLHWHGIDDPTRAVLMQYAPMFAGSFLMCSTTVVDQAMAGALSNGSVAALSYANKIVGLVIAVCATALSTAVLPYFSQMAARQDWEGCRHTLKKYTFMILSLTIPATAGLITFTHPVVRFLFQRGAFSAADTALVSKVQAFYAIQIPFYICGMLFVRFLSAARRNDVLMYGSTLSLVLDISLNLLFMRRYGVSGIALSTSMVYIVSFIFLGVSSVILLSKRISWVSDMGIAKRAQASTNVPS